MPAKAPLVLYLSGDLFDVTCIIGSVYGSSEGGETPNQAAFRLIADHGAQGDYEFPQEDGTMTRVTVRYGDAERGM
jgi:hypothetical protein